jgi:hypothetical protein
MRGERGDGISSLVAGGASGSCGRLAISVEVIFLFRAVLSRRRVHWQEWVDFGKALSEDGSCTTPARRSGASRTTWYMALPAFLSPGAESNLLPSGTTGCVTGSGRRRRGDYSNVDVSLPHAASIPSVVNFSSVIPLCLALDELCVILKFYIKIKYLWYACSRSIIPHIQIKSANR